MERYICIHGHFYQPPRENPSLEAVEIQDSAYPYHDWNERITAECYGPNGSARILDGDGRIERIVNNYARMSFNFGPTLLAWMEQKAPEVYRSVLAADRESQDLFSGHGSAIAQAYNHIILPLANQRDRHTQVLWGIRDFEHRFGRRPEGMWLPETAVDLETLDILAELGIRFTILAQHQASRVRKLGGRTWRDVTGGLIDATRAYELHLPSGRKISLFFYDGPISRAVAFERLLDRGEHLADRLMGAYSDSRPWSQLAHIATDGESYGHHHRYGDMALAYAMHYIESNNLARLTNYGEFLERFPPTHQVEIYPSTSWSCAHGIERWNSNCGCNSGGYPGWTQEWREPLRKALDWLRDALAPHYERRARRLLTDPWAARDDYISVVLERSPESIQRFLDRHTHRQLSEADRVRTLKLLEIQRHAMLMYTSCGWFFDELSGIETVQVIQYAGRAVQLAADVFGESLEPRFLELLERAKSNIDRHRDGRHIYEKWVKPSLANLEQVGAHYAISSLFESFGEQTVVYSYSVDREDYRLLSSGKVKLALGRARITSRVTQEARQVSFGVLHLGDHNLSGGVREFRAEDTYAALVQRIEDAFERLDLTDLLRIVDRSFGSNSYSLRLLFRDQQRKILETILDSTQEDTEAVFRQVYEHQAPMMRFLTDLSVPMPRAWHAAADLVVNNGLRKAFRADDLDLDGIAALLSEAKTWQISLDGAGLGYTLRQTLEEMAERFRGNPTELDSLQKLEAAVEMARGLPFEVDLWKIQNSFYEMMQTVPNGLWSQVREGDCDTDQWIERFAALGEKLGVRVVEMRERVCRVAPNVAALAEELATGRRVPRATYRLQFGPGLTFGDATALIPYLDDLGISDCYASPLLMASRNSSHGYDTCDHSRLSPVLGTEEDFEAFSSALRARGMGLLLDTVPNHMGIRESTNIWWMDVLENGPSSVYACFFDIDWQPVKPELKNKILLPILEDQYGKVLEGGKLRLAYEEGAFFIHYYETKLPVAPRTYSSILGYQVDTLVQALGEENEQVRELQSIITAINYLPPRTELSPERLAERNREKEVIKGRIDSLYQASAYVRAAIDTAVGVFNGRVDDPHSFDMLDELIDAQVFRPAYWRVATEEINYRRFFDINDLAAIRVEQPEVFEGTHSLILRLLAEGKVTGLRIDHPDGLWNPTSYFHRLQESYILHQVRARVGEGDSRDDLESTASAWVTQRSERTSSEMPRWPLYVVAEKILSEGEPLPEEWAIDGTTGYDFLNTVNGLFVDTGNRRAFDSIYHGFTGLEVSFRNLTNSTKKMIMLVSLASEINALGHQLERIAETSRLYRDFTLNSLTFAIREIIAALPIYRTYVTGSSGAGQQDQAYLEAAVAEAKRRNPRTATTIFDFIRDSLLLRNLHDFREEDQARLVNWVMRFQQITGPAMAKGVEDTAFYVYNRLVSLNEVGGHPEQFGMSVATFHRQNSERRQRWPHSMLASSTHDTKRGEDVRARIDVLSEVPEEWRAALARWGKLNAPKKTPVDGDPAPDRNDEYLLYQTLLGAWPMAGAEGDATLSEGEFHAFRERIAAYMLKATKEAKTHTSWVNANEQYDAAVQEFVRRVLPSPGGDPFVDGLLALQRTVAYFGQFNSLSQLLLKLTSPGVPDIYQGTEMWDFSLVDPDNRRPVDYRLRRSLLADLKGTINRSGEDLTALVRQLLESSRDGRIKLFLLHRTLAFRRDHQGLFSEGSYLPLDARGYCREHVCAFTRILDGEAAVVVVPRLVVRLSGGEQRPPMGEGVWKDTWLSLHHDKAGHGRSMANIRYRNHLTGEVLTPGERNGMPGLPLSQLLGHFPVALLERLPQ